MIGCSDRPVALPVGLPAASRRYLEKGWSIGVGDGFCAGTDGYQGDAS